MTLTARLSTESIHNVIAELTQAKEDIDYAVNELTQTLASDGADIANGAYGSMVSANAQSEGIGESKIVVSGGDKAIIAEFGAGYATMEYHPFAKNAPVPIEPVSYSRLHGGLLWVTDLIEPGHGYWYWGSQLGGSLAKGIHKWGSLFGNKMDRVQPKHGLLDAYDYISDNYLKVWKEVSDI